MDSSITVLTGELLDKVQASITARPFPEVKSMVEVQSLFAPQLFTYSHRRGWECYDLRFMPNADAAREVIEALAAHDRAEVLMLASGGFVANDIADRVLIATGLADTIPGFEMAFSIILAHADGVRMRRSEIRFDPPKVTLGEWIETDPREQEMHDTLLGAVNLKPKG